MKPVRLGFVGLGGRGSYHLDSALGMDGVEVPALCEIDDSRLQRAKSWVVESNRPEQEDRTESRDHGDDSRLHEERFEEAAASESSKEENTSEQTQSKQADRSGGLVIEHCPFCRAKVVRKSDGTCPRCQSSME